jgi:transcriptional regulator with XRE-family HTH domain
MPKKVENFDSQEMIYRREVGERLKEYRLSRGVSQQDVARATGVQQPSVVRYEAGLREIHIYFIKRFVEKYGCDLHWLVFGSEEQK